MIRIIFALLLFALFGAQIAAAESGGGFPQGSGVIDVRDFGAVGDGVADDTAAILAAIQAARGAPGRTFWLAQMVYLPAGRYKISDTLLKRDVGGHFDSGMALVGDGRGRTILQLSDHADGFGDAGRPKAVVMTTARLLDGSPTSGNKDYLGKGEGNDAYANYVEDLTIDVGTGNPGAVALDFLANNVGAVRRVDLVGKPGSGLIGLSLMRKWIGPALINDVTMHGFDVGIAVANSEYGITMAHVAVVGSREAGLRNDGNVVSADRLDISPAQGPAIVNADPGGLIVARNLTLKGSGGPAIVNRGYLNLTDGRAEGFASTGLAAASAEKLDGVYDPQQRLSDTAWRLAPADPPSDPSDPVASWTSVTKFGASPDGISDSTAAINRAFHSGARTIYFPHGNYVITAGIEIPTSVERIVGMFSAITVSTARQPSFDRQLGMFRVTGRGKPLSIEKLTFDMTDKGGQLAIDQIGERTLVLEDIVTAGAKLVDRRAEAGELYASNVCCGPVSTAGPRGVWFRQFNSEGGRMARLANSGSPVRILGIKTEQAVTIIRNIGGTIDVVGGLVYPVMPSETQAPIAINENGRVTLAYAEESFRADAVYATHLVSLLGGAAETVAGQDLPLRNKTQARIVPQLTAGQ